MALSKELRIENVVILANNFNPSIFASHWLIGKGVCTAEEILPTSTFALNISQLDTNMYQLLVLMNQMQFTKLPSFNGDFSDLVKSKLSLIVNKLPEIPYASAGINFNWFVKDNALGIPQLSKKLFFNKDSKLHSYFAEDNARVGTYLSKDIDDVRLKLDIKPVLAVFNPKDKPEEFIQWNFNYHIDINGNQPRLVRFLADHSKFFKMANEIIDLYA